MIKIRYALISPTTMTNNLTIIKITREKMKIQRITTISVNHSKMQRLIITQVTILTTSISTFLLTAHCSP